ncbi:Oidioi.mRNA.OKI2018_I69.chr1.g324.t1.cds [Oikopleura dioica]|uniref:Oidioi.mRNA.OKI2018_I69.chr1.g324.t1.cds n=1 Tax=Oikopleura dioica TaxID=34765 RepID=A0ABN7SNB7_OIKDI|nr:Oidioi.mRNA.OKI2018_I69.chr1.g324.t1.cds [Oikopleura dioica]
MKFLFFLLFYKRLYAEILPKSQEQIILQNLIHQDYNKLISPIFPRYGVLTKDGSKDLDRIRRVCEKTRTMLRRYGYFFTFDEGLMANIAFNCRAEIGDLDFIDACIDWVGAIWYKNRDAAYSGHCDKQGSPLQKIIFEKQNLSTPLLDDTDIFNVEHIVDIQTIYSAEPNLMSILGDLYPFDYDSRLQWDFKKQNFSTQISIDPSLIWTPPIEIVNLDLWRNNGQKTDFSCTVDHIGRVTQAYKCGL